MNECVRIRDEIKKYMDELERMKLGDPRILEIREKLPQLYYKLAIVSGKIKLTEDGKKFYCIFCGYDKIPMKKAVEFFGGDPSLYGDDEYITLRTFSSLQLAGMHLFEVHYDKVCS